MKDVLLGYIVIIIGVIGMYIVGPPSSTIRTMTLTTTTKIVSFETTNQASYAQILLSLSFVAIMIVGAIVTFIRIRKQERVKP